MAKIMIVDDEPDTRDSIKKGLEHLDPEFEVIRAESGRQCFEYLENNQLPNVILLDIMMHGLNGWVVLHKLKKNEGWKDIPIIISTALNDKQSREIGEYLANDYIEKPFELEDLKRRIDKVLK